MLRFLTTSAVVILFLILTIPVLIVEWIIGFFNPHFRDISSLRIVQGAFLLCMKTAGIHRTVIGRENIITDGPALYVLNHRSIMDILLVYTLMPRVTGFVAKKELKKAPLLNIWMKRLYCLFLDRENPKEGMKMVLTAISQIKEGISICICPEGTRSDSDTMLPFKEGSFKIATKPGCPIVPIAINNSSANFEDHFPRMKKTHVIVEIAAPIPTKDLSTEEKKALPASTQALIQEMVNKNAALVAEGNS